MNALQVLIDRFRAEEEQREIGTQEAISADPPSTSAVTLEEAAVTHEHIKPEKELVTSNDAATASQPAQEHQTSSPDASPAYVSLQSLDA